MILTNRLFEREQPTREAKSIYIFCEGARREYDYFIYFSEIDSRINVEVYKLSQDEDNSPLGLLEIAKKSILKDDHSQNPKYDFQDNDEVWIVLDTDPDKENSKRTQIDAVKKFCKEMTEWYLSESNPCFEVWLYYHLFKEKLTFTGDDLCANWKTKVNESIKGGFDSRKHPIFIDKAIKNSQSNFQITNSYPSKGCTEVFLLGKSITLVLREKLDKALDRLKE
jgi:hypothetical protein